MTGPGDIAISLPHRADSAVAPLCDVLPFPPSVKRSVLTDARGVPIAVSNVGANAHDQTLVRETFQNLRVRRSRASRRRRQHLCADKGNDAKAYRQLANAPISE